MVYVHQTAPAGFFAAGMSGELIPLPKDNQPSPTVPKKIRPIVIANLGRKLADKHVKALDAKGQEELFRNSNYAVGAKCGSDIFFHLQQVLSEQHPDRLTTQHDFANAFNNASRSTMVDQYTLLRPEMVTHRRNALAVQPHLCVVTPQGPTTVQSQSGTQQGGPLSSLDHAMSIRPLINELQAQTEELGSGIARSFADDVVVMAPLYDTLRCCDIISQRGPDVGAYPQWDKFSALIGPQPTTGGAEKIREDLFNKLKPSVPPRKHDLLFSNIHLHPTNGGLSRTYGIISQGAPIGSPDFIVNFLSTCLADISSEIDKLIDLGFLQFTWVSLLKVIKPKFNHLLRMLPPSATRQFIAEAVRLQQRIVNHIAGGT